MQLVPRPTQNCRYFSMALASPQLPPKCWVPLRNSLRESASLLAPVPWCAIPSSYAKYSPLHSLIIASFDQLSYLWTLALRSDREKSRLRIWWKLRIYRYFVTEPTNGIDEIGWINWKVTLSFTIMWICVALILYKGIDSFGKVSLVWTLIVPKLKLLYF